MKILYILFVSLVGIQLANSQSVKPDAIATAGGHFKGSSVSLSWTIGQVITSTYTGTDFVLTHGVHQDFAVETTSVAHPQFNSSFTLYPVPATNYLNVTFKGDEKKANRIRILTMDGQFVLETGYTIHHHINIENLNAGYYLVRIIDKNNAAIHTTRFIKH